LDSCLGPMLKARADAAGVVLTDMAGDQPAVIMDLMDEVRLLGFRPILAGNIKSLLDHKRTPETQKAFAEAHGQRPKMITSFADGTKIAAEMGVVSNATGFGVAERGMRGPRAERVEQAPERFDIEALLQRPIVDYLLGAEPSFGVFVLGYDEDPVSSAYMTFYKMGAGPVYTFYRPFHLGPFETVQSVARAVLLHDAAATPLGAPVTEVVAQAKRQLKSGEKLDGIGGFTVYGMLENVATARRERLLPMGLTDGAVLIRDVAEDVALTFDDVDVPANRLATRLWHEQAAHFGLPTP
jgi:predicted homoserine dehydrogenase-like protein